MAIVSLHRPKRLVDKCTIAMWVSQLELWNHRRLSKKHSTNGCIYLFVLWRNPPRLLDRHGLFVISDISVLSHTERPAISVKAVLQSVLSSVIVCWESCALAMDYLLLFVLVVPTSAVISIKVTQPAYLPRSKHNTTFGIWGYVTYFTSHCRHKGFSWTF